MTRTGVASAPIHNRTSHQNSSTGTTILDSSQVKPRPQWKASCESAISAICAWVPVGVALFMLGWSLCAFLLEVGSLMQHDNFTLRVVSGSVCSYFCAMAIWSYSVVIRTDPGSPAVHESGLFTSGAQASDIELQHHNSKFASDGSGMAHLVTGHDVEAAPLVQLQNMPVTVKENGAMRFCRKCELPKPDRAHHCSQCKRCVLKMDHHCPWVNNCVGFYNYKAFILFLVYTVMYCVAIFAFCIPYVGATLRLNVATSSGKAFQILTLLLMSFIVGLCLTAFCVYHGNLLLSNRTTIESMEKHRYAYSQPRNENLFDIGWRRNFMQVMGKAPLLWFLPILNVVGNGQHFPTNLHPTLDSNESASA